MSHFVASPREREKRDRIVEEMKERYREERETGMKVKKQKKFKHSSFTLTCYKVLRKHAYSNILKISPPKTKYFQIKKSDIFHTSAQNIDCGYLLEPPRRGGSNAYYNLCL